MTPWAAVVLAGGAGRRLGGTDKPALVIGGRTLLDRAVAACAGAERVVVVGPRRPTSSPVTWTREEPPGSGPLAALAAGLAALGPPGARSGVLVVLAADLPEVSPGLVGRLIGALEPPADGAVVDPLPDGAAVVDPDGWVQPLVAVYRAAPLAAALDAVGDPRNRPLRDLLPHLVLRTVPDAAGASDIDTPDDLARWQTGPVEDVGTAAKEG